MGPLTGSPHFFSMNSSQLARNVLRNAEATAAAAADRAFRRSFVRPSIRLICARARSRGLQESMKWTTNNRAVNESRVEENTTLNTLG